MRSLAPSNAGLYDPSYEHDACGLGFVARIDGEQKRSTVDEGLEILRNLAHRGAAGSEPETGDGAGIMIQIPDAFLREKFAEEGDIELPPAGEYGVGVAFIDGEDDHEDVIERVVAEEGQSFIGSRDVPVLPEKIGNSARGVMPRIRQFFIRSGEDEQGNVLDESAVDGQAEQMAENLPEGYEASGEPTTDEQGNTVQRATDDQGNTVDFTFDEQGNVLDEAEVDEQAEQMAENLPEGYEATGELTTDERAGYHLAHPLLRGREPPDTRQPDPDVGDGRQGSEGRVAEKPRRLPEGARRRESPERTTRGDTTRRRGDL